MNTTLGLEPLGLGGTVVATQRQHRPPQLTAGCTCRDRSWRQRTSKDATAEPSRVTFDIEQYGQIVRLTVTHENLADEVDRDAAAAGWPAVLSNLKSLIETGSALPQEPWLLPQR